MTQMERRYQINMPQMAMGGLSESWLFKEMGDIHWALITEGLGTQSSLLVDANGSRLYATFTRIKLNANVPLIGFRENDQLTATAQISRYAGSYFFSDMVFSAGDRRIEAKLMSTFTQRAKESSNATLMKGRPVIDERCQIAELMDPPLFASEYREHRTAHEQEHRFATTYDLQPCHDINGVNLLYFAAYPAIGDLCEMRSEPRPIDWFLSRSTLSRDIFYAANCDVHDRIEYKLHQRMDTASSQQSRSTLTRASDGKLMAFMITDRALVRGLN